MIGRVQNTRATLPVSFRLPGRGAFSVEFVVDTGFSGELTLPPAVVSALRLPYTRTISAHLADASSIQINVYLAVIVWNGTERTTEVLATGDHPLVGVLLMTDCELNIEWVEGGVVRVEAL